MYSRVLSKVRSECVQMESILAQADERLAVRLEQEEAGDDKRAARAVDSMVDLMSWRLEDAREEISSLESKFEELHSLSLR